MRTLENLLSPLTSGVAGYKNIHKNETCYIFGDGPSIKWFDLDKFSNHPAICCGVIPFHKDFHKLDVRYVCTVEPWLYAPKFLQPKFLHGLRPLAEEYKKLMMERLDKAFFISASNWPFLRGRNINYVYRSLPYLDATDDVVLRQCDCFSGSFHATLSLAYYLGFRKVYLVGFDAWTIRPALTSRWYEYGEGQPYEATNFAFDFLKLLKAKMEILTISRSGNSCNVKNIKYSTYTGSQPDYKENHELLNSHFLNVLNHCDDYRIFDD